MENKKEKKKNTEKQMDIDQVNSFSDCEIIGRE
jgi:hypothetical protein